MLIGIDGNEANIEKKVGVGRYAHELLKQFYELRITNYELRIYLKDKPLPDLPKQTDWWRYSVVGPSKFWTQIGLPLALYTQRPKPDVFFTPTHYAPRFCPCPRVISIMDLSYLHFPEMFKKKDLWQLKNWTAYSVKKAKKILTISDSSRNDIMKYYQVPKEKVIVTYPGYEMKSVTRNSQSAIVRQKYKIAGNYILSVGTLQPRKNYIRLIEAFSTLKNLDYQLVIAGKPGWLYQEIYEAPKKFNVEKKVKFLNYVPDQDLPSLYQGASCFVLVSLYEGFGIPVLEAMIHHCPVVVANISSLPEVAGDAGILVDPYDIKDIAAGILKALHLSPEERKVMISQGLKQASKFSWEKTARQTLKVLEEIGRET